MWQLALAAAVAGSGLFATQFLTSNNTDPVKETLERSDLCDGSGFKFSSPDLGLSHSGKKNGGCGGNRGKLEGRMRKCDGGVKVLEKKKSGKGFGVCVKKRRVSKFGPGKCDACSNSKGNSNFSQGVGVGIMCIMSAGKAEITKLNAAMDETAKVVHELKSELSKRKESHIRQVSSSKLEINTNLEEPRGKDIPLLPQVNAQVNAELELKPQGEVMEMDLLEAELKLELQKLSWCSSDASAPEERGLDSYENDASTEVIYELDRDLSISLSSNGVAPSVLNQKLTNLLLKQQEGQIVELEQELNQTQSKLHEKEAELRSLKECVRRMSQLSMTNASDEEQVEEKSNDHCTKIGTESKRAIVGMKRAMSFESFTCLTQHSI